MKIAPIMKAMEGSEALEAMLVHTGQHYDNAMNNQFFAELGIPEPEVNLEVGSASHAVQTAEIMKRFEPVVDAEKPDKVLVVGDVNSTIACALVASKKGIPVVHVEAGLRSFDRTMPEEINRVLTDQISDVLFTTERLAKDNLLREGILEGRIHFVGNVMIDTLHLNLQRAVPPENFTGDVSSRPYAALTLHRPSNVDDSETLRSLLMTIREIAEKIDVVFPVHPRTKGKIEQFGLDHLLQGMHVLPPLGYLEMLGLMKHARLFLTDSGGIQEETTALGIPCITLRNNTERQITIDEGTNTLAGQDSDRIMAIFSDIMKTGGKTGKIPEYWDGKASLRIVEILSTQE